MEIYELSGFVCSAVFFVCLFCLFSLLVLFSRARPPLQLPAMFSARLAPPTRTRSPPTVILIRRRHAAFLDRFSGRPRRCRGYAPRICSRCRRGAALAGDGHSLQSFLSNFERSPREEFREKFFPPRGQFILKNKFLWKGLSHKTEVRIPRMNFKFKMKTGFDRVPLATFLSSPTTTRIVSVTPSPRAAVSRSIPTEPFIHRRNKLHSTRRELRCRRERLETFD